MDAPTSPELIVSLPDATWRRELRRRLLRWYEHNARELPWRGSGAPYHVWLSEIMLQQTQVATVVPYFERFLTALPTIADLAAAPEQQVLRLWEGLGYYRRARQLHAAAQVVVDQHEGRFPRDLDQVRSLPGVGRYTAGAIVSIAFDTPAPILEANTTRLFARLLAYDQDPRKTAGQRLLWEFADQILPRKRAGDFNQALMEVGAEVCRPRNPLCKQCPLKKLCATCSAGLQEQIPATGPRPQFEDVTEALVVVRRDQRVLLRLCTSDERWAGMWDFPRLEIGDRTGRQLHSHLAEGVFRQTGVKIQHSQRFTTIKHCVTRFRITLHCHQANCAADPTHNNPHTTAWADIHELDDYPLNTTARRVARLLAAEE